VESLYDLTGKDMAETASRSAYIFVVAPAATAARYEWDAPRVYREEWNEHVFWLLGYDSFVHAMRDRQQADTIVDQNIGDAALLLSPAQSIITPVFVTHNTVEYEVYADVRAGAPTFRVYDSAGRWEGEGATIREAFARLRPRTVMSCVKRQWEVQRWRLNPEA